MNLYEDFAKELYWLEQKYAVRLLGVFDGARELELIDIDSMEYHYVSKEPS